MNRPGPTRVGGSPEGELDTGQRLLQALRLTPLSGDTLNEGPETYFVNLSSPVNATLARAQGTGTITDNDAVPSLRINDVSVTEGDTGTINAVFTVVLSAASGRNVSVSYATANKGAMAGQDYIAQTGTLLFAPGTTAQTISVPVVGDTLPETGEAMNLNLSGAINATIADNQGRCTLIDDDAAPTISIGDVRITEGDSGSANVVFTVSLSKASTSSITVAYATANGTALAGSDYAAKSSKLSFPAGATSKTLSVKIYGDRIPEPEELFYTRLTSPTNATISKGEATATIRASDGG